MGNAKKTVSVVICGVALMSFIYFGTSDKQLKDHFMPILTELTEQSQSRHPVKLQIRVSQNDFVKDSKGREFKEEQPKQQNNNEFVATNSHKERGRLVSIKNSLGKKRDDPYCLKTLEGKIDQDAENNWIIPDKDRLSSLPPELIDCLYFRYTTSLQKFCAKRSRHGSILHGWNLCEDGCFSPSNETVVHVLSLPNEQVSDWSVNKMHQSRVQRYIPKFPKRSDIEPMFIVQRRNDKNRQQFESREERNLTYEVQASKNDLNILIIDVGPSTTQTINHVIKSGILNHVQQLSIRTNYTRPLNQEVDQITALNQLKELYNLGFRIYWSRMEEHCILNGDQHRTGCIYIDMVYKSCRDEHELEEHKALVIPENNVLNSMDKNEVAEFYFRYLSSTQTLCKEVVRLGGIQDGGWNMCHDEKYRPSKPCLVYSFGIKWDFKFDDAVADAYGCEIHSFDPSMNTSDFRRSEHISFHNLGLLDKRNFWYRKRNWNMSTLSGIREDLGHTSKTLDILKIDIEKSEWPALPQMIRSGSIRDVKQLYLEFHSFGTVHHLNILRQLYVEGFRIFWYHRNPKCWFNSKFVQYTWCNEVYFVRE